MEKLDVAVIGASQAGLFLASILAEGGVRVGVFEQRPREFPATRRTLIVTPYLIRNFHLPLKSSLLNRVRIMALESPGARAVISFRSPDLIIERSAFLEELAELAQEVGATIRWGHRFEAMETDARGMILTFRRNGATTRTRTGILVGADGALTRVGRMAGIGTPPVVSVLHAEILLPNRWDPKVAKVWFDVRRTRFFYWLMAENDHRGVVGIADPRPRTIYSLLQEFLVSFNLKVLGFQGARVALHHPLFRPWGQVQGFPVYLVGDAAGQVKVTTVGGTVTGLRGAQALARAILRGTPYSHELRSLKRELDLHWWIKTALDHLDNRGYDLLLRQVRDHVRNFLARHTRDEMFSVFWKLLLRDPSLVLLGVWYGMKGLSRLRRKFSHELAPSSLRDYSPSGPTDPRGPHQKF